MYSVYKITNLINNKSYIGSSVRVEKRWQEHKNCAFRKNDPKYNYPLYQAFRKYGLENFVFEILSDDFENIEEMQKYEQNMILFYNSLSQGYNQTLETFSNNIANENLQKHIDKISCKCAKIDKNNNILEKYKSYHDAARKNGLDGDYCASSIRDVCKGKISSCYGNIYRDLDSEGKIIEKPFKNYKGKKALIGINLNNGSEIYFESITEAAKLLDSDRRSIGLCISGSTRYSNVKGYVLRELDINGNILEVNPTIDEIFEEYNRKNPVINGERHNINDWCKIYGISRPTYYNRIRNGMSQIEAITIPSNRR